MTTPNTYLMSRWDKYDVKKDLERIQSGKKKIFFESTAKSL